MARQDQNHTIVCATHVLEISCPQVKHFLFYSYPIFGAYLFAEYLLSKHLIVQVMHSLLSLVSYNSVSVRGKTHFIQIHPLSNPTTSHSTNGYFPC